MPTCWGGKESAPTTDSSIWAATRCRSCSSFRAFARGAGWTSVSARWVVASGAQGPVLAPLDAPHPFGTGPRAGEMDGAFVADAARTLGWPPDELPGADVDQVSWLCDQLGGGDEVRAQVTRRFA